MDTPVGHERNAEQIAYWNGSGGQHWAVRQEMQDGLLAPVSDILLEHAAPIPGERVVDVGCGCGATTVAFAHRVAPGGHVLGVDISAPMLSLAQTLAPKHAPVSFALADATVHPFEQERFDLLVSRFGVMFFAQPALSFANMRKALRSGGRLAFACWRTPRDNPWLILPLRAAYAHVPKLPELGPDDPGPFAFASEDRVRTILTEAGFAAIEFARHDLLLDIAAGGGLDVAVRTAAEIGPASRAMEDQPVAAQAAATEAIRLALAPLVQDGKVPLGASIWIVSAINP